MKHSKISYLAIVFVLVAVILAACSPAATQAPAAASTQPPAAPMATATPAAAAPTATAARSGDTASPTSTPASGGDAKPAGVGLTYTLVAGKSEASYAVREQLAQRDLPSDAIGKTNAITGSITIKPDGSIDSANSKFTVDLSTLQTDQAMRDNYVRRSILQTSQYPNAVFVPTQASGLPASIPQSGDISFQVTGNLTIRDVTKPVTWDVKGSIANDLASGTATTVFTFEDFNLTQPRVPVVLSVVDKITLTVTLTLQVAGG